MADQKISELTNITGANLADAYEFVVVDTSADQTKAITFGELKTAFDTGTGFVRVTGDTMTGDLHVDGTNTVLLITEDSEGVATLRLGDTQADVAQSFAIEYDTSSEVVNFKLDNTHRAMFNTGGDLLIGPATTNTPFTIYNANNDATKAGVGLRYDGYLAAARYNDFVMQLNRMNSDGEILGFRKNGAPVGSIGVGGSSTYFGRGSTGLGFAPFSETNSSIFPYTTTTNTVRDNAIDLGYASARFDDIYATNGIIQTSDLNEKEAIASLTPAEMFVAARLSYSFKNFKWKDAVAEKGLEAARMHSGIIAQDVQDAFAAEGLDASDYAMFISGTWWETQTDVPAVEAFAEAVDEEGNVVTEAVEAKEAYTRTDTYHTLEEAPEGATERTRLGIRYPELLAFVAAYNDQRFLTIEARLTALEA